MSFKSKYEEFMRVYTCVESKYAEFMSVFIGVVRNFVKIGLVRVSHERE